MKTEHIVSKIMSHGVKSGLILMSIGLALSFLHRGGAPELFVFAGVAALIGSAALSLVYFMFHFFYNKEKFYAAVCLAILLFLAGVTALKVF